MDAIEELVEPETSTSAEQGSRVERISDGGIRSLRGIFETEVSGVFDRLMTEVAAAEEAAVERATAPHREALEATRAALEEQSRRNDRLTESLLQTQIEVEELQLKLQVECENSKAARGEYEQERSARERAQALREDAQAAREQAASAYESRLRAIQEELDGVRAESCILRQQLEDKTSERARLLAALKTVRQACALAEPAADPPREARPNGLGHTSADVDDGSDSEAETAECDNRMGAEDLQAAPAPETGPSLKLVARSQPTTDEAPAQLLEYVKQLFEQIATMYWVDERAYASVDVVDRLGANLRYARDAFVQRAGAEGIVGVSLFERALSAALDEHNVTALGRHLAVAAYDLTQAAETSVPQ